ncbi:DUF2490 domain-containing protein [uncultured Polaribacter sp.]|uniref:DUF2490 domain-containing protein n=1 Tax=uncultured Polaribacter sp. TaxID=174711 RepID=UPI00262D2AC6|nr:DUF2490 domain-containing protein [uncultured Polaribacter sp.]
MIKNTLFLLLFVLCCQSKIFSQANLEIGFLPKVVFAHKLNSKTKWINSLETRQIIYDKNFQFIHNLIDFSSIYSVKTSSNQSFNFGYILRFRRAETIHRTFQHYNFVNQFSTYKLGHRLALEQFYQSKKQTTYRTRYRLSVEKPLQGERVDVKEFYLKLGNEYLYDFTDLEIRCTPYLGYQVSKKDKIEFGFDYRAGNLFQKETDKTLWFRTTWYISI